MQGLVVTRERDRSGMWADSMERVGPQEEPDNDSWLTRERVAIGVAAIGIFAGSWVLFGGDDNPSQPTTTVETGVTQAPLDPTADIITPVPVLEPVGNVVTVP